MFIYTHLCLDNDTCIGYVLICAYFCVSIGAVLGIAPNCQVLSEQLQTELSHGLSGS